MGHRDNPKVCTTILDAKASKGLKPTVRGTCYSLEAVGVILKSESIFRKAQRALVTARKNGPIPRDAFC
jgi:hypothetical protein